MMESASLVPNDFSHSKCRTLIGLPKLRSQPFAITSSLLANPLRSRSLFPVALSCRQAAVGRFRRKLSPRLSTAQAIRANLLATATVTTRAGRRASKAATQGAFSGLIRAWLSRCA
jgi:hypothetical protein